MSKRSTRRAPARSESGARPTQDQRGPGRSPQQQDVLFRYGTLPLRLFLGVTFLYAGLQKIADPGYLQPGSASYIGTQMQGFAAHSPVGFLFQWFALPFPVLSGIGVIAAELAVGACVLVGFRTRWAAIVGAVLSVLLFLSASWSVSPYFLGSDSIYAVAWVTVAMAGDGGILSLDAWLRFRGEERGPARGQPVVDQDRRRLVLRIGATAIGLIWVLALLPRPKSGGTAGVAGKTAPTPSASPSPSGPAPSASPPPAAGSGKLIGTLNQLTSHGALQYRDPTSGNAAWAVGLGGQSVVAYDATCTHAGCPVNWDSGNHLLVCPCHGAVYDPAHGAQVLQGPAPSPLSSLKVQVDTSGNVYAL